MAKAELAVIAEEATSTLSQKTRRILIPPILPHPLFNYIAAFQPLEQSLTNINDGAISDITREFTHVRLSAL
jgi:hypothetical protein